MSQKVTTTTTESTTVLMYENPTSTKTVVEQTGILLDQQQQQTEYCNNAQKILDIHVDTTASIQVCYEQIQQIVETLCPFLLFPYCDNTNSNEEDNKDEAEIDNNNRRFEIKPLTGGLSNKLFLVSNSNFITDTDTTTGTGTAVGTVLVRIHPDNNNATTSNNDTNTNTSEHKENSYESNNFSIVDREQETKFATWLAKQQQRSSTHAVQDDEENDNNNINNMAPTVYGRFINGRVEEFYQNVVPLSCSQMKVYAPWIAQNLASFHQLDTPPKDVLPRPSTNYDATIYESIHGWLKEAKNVDAGSIVDADQDLLKELCEEWEWLEKELTNPPPQYHQSQSKSQSSSSDENNNNNNHIIVKETLEFIRRVVVTHMDCQPLNILIDDNDKNIPPSTSLRLIDFEYYGWNPIAADIANTFCEYCEMSNLRADYEREYPTLAQQDVFFWNYLLQYDPVRAKQFSSYPRRVQQLQQERNNIDYYDAAGDDDDIDIEWKLFLTTCSNEVGRFSLLSHLGWAIWSIVKAQEEDGIDFDYMVYARHRMEGYAYAKKKFIK